MASGAAPRLLAGLFRPAAVLLGRLRYVRKFALVGMVLLVPLGFVAGAYVDLQRDQIDFSAEERRGVVLMAPLVDLTAVLVAARADPAAEHTRHRPGRRPPGPHRLAGPPARGTDADEPAHGGMPGTWWLPPTGPIRCRCDRRPTTWRWTPS